MELTRFQAPLRRSAGIPSLYAWVKSRRFRIPVSRSEKSLLLAKSRHSVDFFWDKVSHPKWKSNSHVNYPDLDALWQVIRMRSERDPDEESAAVADNGQELIALGSGVGFPGGQDGGKIGVVYQRLILRLH